jgi:septal ring factor EnvC (AmiA/AmiB activator)
MTEQAKPARWHVEKGVPVAWIGALVLQAGVLVYSYATLTSQVQTNTQSIAELDDKFSTQIDKLDGRTAAGATQSFTLDTRLTRLEVKLENIYDSLARIEQALNSRRTELQDMPPELKNALPQ